MEAHEVGEKRQCRQGLSDDNPLMVTVDLIRTHPAIRLALIFVSCLVAGTASGIRSVATNACQWQGEKDTGDSL